MGSACPLSLAKASPCSAERIILQDDERGKTALKAILRDARRYRYLTENPAEDVKGLGESDDETVHVLQPAEIARLLDVADARWRTLYFLAVHTGLRREELLALRWGDLDLASGLLYVRRSLNRFRDGDRYVFKETPLKTRYSRRPVDLSPAVVDALLAFPAGDDPEQDFVFRSQVGGPIDPTTLTAPSSAT